MTGPGDAAECRHGRARPPDVDVPALTALLDGKYADIREMARKNLVEYAHVLDEAIELPTAEFRERVLELVRDDGEDRRHRPRASPPSTAAAATSAPSVAGFETMAFGDLSILVKVGVQFGLFGGAILQLGSKHHHDAYIADLVTGKLMGCFAMTETGHGSNVQALGTFATYDAETREFVITTPDDPSRKDYIGNAAAHASMAVVFAQLEIGGELTGRARVRRTHPGQEGATRSPASASRTTARRSASTASTTAGCGSTASGCRARTCSTGTPRSPRTGATSRRSRTRTAASSRCSAP